jgi:hypothetical protein
MRFHMTHVTKEFHWVCPKWLRSLWYVRRKPCTYLASRLALSPYGLKSASTWALSPESTVGCFQNDFWTYGTFGANRIPILHRHSHSLQMDQNEIPHDPRHLRVPSGASKMFFELVQRKPFTYIASRLLLHPNVSKWASTWASSPRSTIGCV